MGIKSYPKYNKETDSIERKYYYDYDEDKGKPSDFMQFLRVVVLFMYIFLISAIVGILILIYKAFKPIIDPFFPFFMIIGKLILNFYTMILNLILLIFRFVFVTLNLGGFVLNHPFKSLVILIIGYIILKKLLE